MESSEILNFVVSTAVSVYPSVDLTKKQGLKVSVVCSVLGPVKRLLVATV